MPASFARLERRDRVAVLRIDNPPVNALSTTVRRALVDAVAEVNSDEELEALVIRCDGKTFFAGADMKEFDQPPAAPLLPTVVDAIERSGKPVIAAIHGTALGGGLEVALGCTYRVAVRSATFGLPEVLLGLMPGAGGTQRLPRLVGMQAALRMIATGASIGADEALVLGLLDAIAIGDLTEEAVAVARELVGKEIPRTRDRLLVPLPDAAIDRFLDANAKKFSGLAAPASIIDVLRRSQCQSFDQGLASERSAFLALREGAQCRALRHIFFAERESGKVSGLPASNGGNIKAVGVIGAGTMGTGIALVFLLAGFPVTLFDASGEALRRGVGSIGSTIERNLASGRINAETASLAHTLLHPANALEALAQCDLVVEAAFELMEVKREIFAKLDQIAKPGAILATNTSYLDIDEIAATTARPQQVIGLHFFSPANIMKLLEIVRARETSLSVLSACLYLAKRLGKVPVVAGNARGFIGNRLLAVRRREAEKALLLGADPYVMDRVLEKFGMPMGSFRMDDLAGLDLGWNRERSQSSTLREVMCEQGRRGQKTEAGYYDYVDGKAVPSQAALALVREFAQRQGYAQRTVGEEEILERLIYPMVNEGASLLEQGIALRGSDIDVAWIHGYGWPRWTGGPMHYADAVGLDHIVSRLDALGYSDEVSPLLRSLAASGRLLCEMRNI